MNKIDGRLQDFLNNAIMDDDFRIKVIVESSDEVEFSTMIHTLDIFGADIMDTIPEFNKSVILATAEQIAHMAGSGDVKKLWLEETMQMLHPIHHNSEDEKKKRLLSPAAVASAMTWGLRRIKAHEARESARVSGKGVVVGILDTGIDPDHSAFSEGRIIKFMDFTEDSAGVPGKGYDDHGHGTHCAGTIGGELGRSDQYFGVAPKCKFVVGKILGGFGGGSLWGILRAMKWIMDPTGMPKDRPRLVSNSWGSDTVLDVFESAVQAWKVAGILPIFAAGNSGSEPETVGTPGCYKQSLSIGATTEEGTIAWFSSRGPVRYKGEIYIKPDVCAPGHYVHSAWPGGGYKTISGTSMATPHVAGLAALLFCDNPKQTAEDAWHTICLNTDRSEDKDNDWGFGEIDCLKAIKNN